MTATLIETPHVQRVKAADLRAGDQVFTAHSRPVTLKGAGPSFHGSIRTETTGGLTDYHDPEDLLTILRGDAP